MAKDQEKKILNDALAKLQQSGQRRELVRAQERSMVPVQLPIWDDGNRGIPNSLVRGGLFTATKADPSIKRNFYEGKQIAMVGGVSIEYRGQELRQDDLSVFLQILHFGRQYELGKDIPFTAYGMLKALGWSVNVAEYKHLRECCSRLSATSVSVVQTGVGGYEGSLIRSFRWKDENGKQMANWIVLLEPAIAILFKENCFTLIDPVERKAIGGRSPLALWLHSFLSTHREPFAYSVEKYHQLSASRADNMNDFRRRLKIALTRLVEIGFLKGFEVKNDVVHVKRIPKYTKMPAYSGVSDDNIISIN